MARQKREMWALKLSADEKQKLRELADKNGVNMSAMVRLLINRSHDRSKK